MSTGTVPEPGVVGERVVGDGPRSILVGVDASGTSLQAVSWACAEAQRSGRSLHLLHARVLALLGGVVDGPLGDGELEGLSAAAEATLEEAVRCARVWAPGTPVTGTVVMGPAAEVVVEHSRGAALLVLGSHGRGPLARVLLGSVSQQVAGHARCPVVVLRGREGIPVGSSSPGPGRRRQRIVAGVDGEGPAAAAVLGFAFEQASTRGAFLEVVTTWERQPDPLVAVHGEDHEVERLLLSRSSRLLETTVGPWMEKYPDVHVRRNVVEGKAVASLVRRGAGAELLVVGSRGRGSVTGLLLGSVSSGVLQHAVGPVAVVRPQPPPAW